MVIKLTKKQAFPKLKVKEDVWDSIYMPYQSKEDLEKIADERRRREA